VGHRSVLATVWRLRVALRRAAQAALELAARTFTVLLLFPLVALLALGVQRAAVGQRRKSSSSCSVVALGLGASCRT
jgi:hypothetical protein